MNTHSLILQSQKEPLEERKGPLSEIDTLEINIQKHGIRITKIHKISI